MYICFLVGASNPFTFKVLIHVYDPITVFLIVLDLFSVDLFLLLCFLPREVPSALVVKLVSVQFSSLPQSCPTLCDPMDSSMPGFPAHHQLPELAQTLSIESVMLSSHLILCHPLLLLSSIFLSVVLNSLNFCFSEQLLISLSDLNESIAG